MNEEVNNARMTEKEVDALLNMDMNDIVYLFTLDNQPPHSSDNNKQFETVIDECLPEAMENRRREAETIKMTEQHYFSGISGYQLPRFQSRPRPEPQPKPQPDIRKMTQQNYFADICGYQPPRSQPPQPPAWSPEENKVFESIIANCFQDAIRNCPEAVAARLPGKTPAQLQERLQNLMNDISAFENGSTTNTPLNAAYEDMTIMMEHNPLSIPIINGTTRQTPPPPPYWTNHQYYRMEAVAAAADLAVPMDMMLSSSAMSAATRETKPT